MKGEPLLERHTQQVIAQSHRRRQEYALIHECRITADNRLKIHPRQNFALDVDAWSNFDQRQPFRSKFKYTALRHVKHRLVALYCVVAGKRPVLDITNELVHAAIIDDAQTAVLDRNLQTASRKGADEHHLLRVLADVDEAAGARKTRSEFADVQISLPVRLGETQKCCVEPAPIIEIELVGLIDDGLCVDRCAEIESAGRYPSDHTRFGGHRHQIGNFFLIGDVRYAFGHANAEVDDAVGLEFERCAPRNDFAFGQFHGRNCSRACSDFTAKRGVVLNRERLPMVFRPCEDDTIDKNAGYLDLPRVKRAAVGYSLDLCDNEAARIAHGHRNRQHFECKRLLFHRNVAVGIGGGAADDADIDGEGPIEKEFLAIDFKKTDEIVFCAFIDLAAAVARVDERSESDAREMPGRFAAMSRNRCEITP